MNNADILGCTACVGLKLDIAKESKKKHVLSPYRFAKSPTFLQRSRGQQVDQGFSSVVQGLYSTGKALVPSSQPQKKCVDQIFQESTCEFLDFKALKKLILSASLSPVTLCVHACMHACVHIFVCMCSCVCMCIQVYVCCLLYVHQALDQLSHLPRPPVTATLKDQTHPVHCLSNPLGDSDLESTPQIQDQNTEVRKGWERDLFFRN